MPPAGFDDGTVDHLPRQIRIGIAVAAGVTLLGCVRVPVTGARTSGDGLSGGRVVCQAGSWQRAKIWLSGGAPADVNSTVSMLSTRKPASVSFAASWSCG